jgi:flagellar protein FlaG
MTDNRVDRNTASKKVVSEAESSANENKQVSEEELIKVIEKANETIKGNNAKFEYSIHDDTKRIMVKVINPINDEVIREIPSEKILDMVAKIWEMTGILVDEKR